MNKSLLPLIVLGGLILVLAAFVLPTAAITGANEPIPYPIWSIEEVAPAGYSHVLALDSANRPHLLFHDADAGKLRHAVRYQSGWAIDNVANVTINEPDMSFDMAIGPNNIPCIVYATDPEVISFPLDTTLTYGCRQNNKWALTSIDDGGRSAKLIVDTDNEPHIALVQGQEAAYLTREGNQWIKEYVAEDEAFMGRVWLSLDNNGTPHLIYSGSEGTFEGIRQMAYLWTIAPFPFPVPLTRDFDSANRSWMLISESEPQSGHPPFSFNRLLLAVPDGSGGWTTGTLDEDYDWSIAADLAVQGSDTAHVAFRDVSGVLHYRWWSAYAGWQAHSPDSLAGAEVQLALGEDDQPRISYGWDGKVYVAVRRIISLDHFSYLPSMFGPP
jgi:hypothetical protein